MARAAKFAERALQHEAAAAEKELHGKGDKALFASNSGTEAAAARTGSVTGTTKHGTKLTATGTRSGTGQITGSRV